MLTATRASVMEYDGTTGTPAATAISRLSSSSRLMVWMSTKSCDELTTDMNTLDNLSSIL